MRLDMVQSGAGLGDVRLTGGWQFFRGEAEMPGEIALRASLKLPTGDSDTLRGSGSTDLALWLVGKKDFQMPLGRGSVFGGMGAIAMTDGKVLKDQQRPLVGFGTLGIGEEPPAMAGAQDLGRQPSILLPRQRLQTSGRCLRPTDHGRDPGLFPQDGPRYRRYGRPHRDDFPGRRLPSVPVPQVLR